MKTDLPADPLSAIKATMREACHIGRPCSGSRPGEILDYLNRCALTKEARGRAVNETKPNVDEILFAGVLHYEPNGAKIESAVGWSSLDLWLRLVSQSSNERLRSISSAQWLGWGRALLETGADTKAASAICPAFILTLLPKFDWSEPAVEFAEQLIEAGFDCAANIFRYERQPYSASVDYSCEETSLAHALAFACKEKNKAQSQRVLSKLASRYPDALQWIDSNGFTPLGAVLARAQSSYNAQGIEEGTLQSQLLVDAGADPLDICQNPLAITAKTPAMRDLIFSRLEQRELGAEVPRSAKSAPRPGV